MPALLLFSVLAAGDCPQGEPRIVVDTASHALLLCERGELTRRFEIAIGSNGPAPRRVGWAQTPLGDFTLLAPRPSSSFHVFVPLKNPDPARFSAWAIGIHGPQRGWEHAGHVNVETNWTLGCIAVSSDEEMDFIAQWIRTAHARRITVR